MAARMTAAIVNRSARMSWGSRIRRVARSSGKVVPQIAVMRRSDPSAMRLVEPEAGRAGAEAFEAAWLTASRRDASAARPARGPGVQRLDREGEALELDREVHVP